MSKTVSDNFLLFDIQDKPQNPDSETDCSKNSKLIVYSITTDKKTKNGLLYDVDGSGTISAYETTLRTLANTVYTAINEQGER